MKKILYLFAIVTLFSFSCKPDRICCVLPKPEMITAQKNGEAWQSVIIASRLVLDSVIIAAKYPFFSTTPAADSLGIKFIYAGIGTYKMTDKQVVYVSLNNGVPTHYSLDTTYNNVLNINTYQVLYDPYTTVPDPTEIKGTFNLRFTDPTHTTSISLLDGNFTALLRN